MSELPKVALVTQNFSRPKLKSINKRIQASFEQTRSHLPPLIGKRIAVAVGSRGLTNLTQIVQSTVSLLKKCGAKPFVVSAMGSHGGATDRGQEKILSHYGITNESISAPVVTSVRSVHIGETPDGVPVFFDQKAFESDGVVLINRIKPHTDFHGEIESGLLKLAVVGLGNIRGAETFHSWTLKLPSDHLIQSIARVSIGVGKVLFGIAILENAYHETADLEVISATQILEREKELLRVAKTLMPSLPIDQLDVLIVDRIGKNISGSGMDPNVTGRCFRINSRWQEKPDITRIIVLGLTELSGGNASGIGLADFCSRRSVEQMDRKITYLNAMTARQLVCAQIPIHFDSDRETIKCAISTSGTPIPSKVRLIRILDTLNLTQLEASQALIPELQNHHQVSTISSLRELKFDNNDQLPQLRV